MRLGNILLVGYYSHIIVLLIVIFLVYFDWYLINNNRDLCVDSNKLVWTMMNEINLD